MEFPCGHKCIKEAVIRVSDLRQWLLCAACHSLVRPGEPAHMSFPYLVLHKLLYSKLGI